MFVPEQTEASPIDGPGKQGGLRWSHAPHDHADSVWESTDDEVCEERRRPGRPVMYSGDPDAKHLTDQQKRQIKRRISNRASARRMEVLKFQLRAAEERNALLEDNYRAVHAKWIAAEVDRTRLQDEVAFLKALQCGSFDAATV
ncbi:hypothetical protein WJX73_007177 [Symbiochloris irregularis]|uniref:BZIP domain-containing protein n=1 Tax=Symbiochloris irregularis TaxID=706552 RepID=A0AAW1NRN1_9CHLO